MTRSVWVRVLPPHNRMRVYREQTLLNKKRTQLLTFFLKEFVYKIKRSIFYSYQLKLIKIQLIEQANSSISLNRIKRKQDFFRSRKLYQKKWVWSWLRMNAGGMPNTCKSNAVFFCFMQLHSAQRSTGWRTGEERVRIYQADGVNPP